MPKPLIAVVLLLAGCAASEDQLRSRAAFDLDCPEHKLQIVEIDDKTRGVRGCDQHATYLEHCARQNPGGGPCTWVLNSDTTPEARDK